MKNDGLSMSGKSDVHYPNLEAMLDYIIRQQTKLLDSTEMREQRLLFPSNTYVVMIKFLLKCFESELEQNKSIGDSSTFLSAIEHMCLLVEHAMAFEGSVELHATASKALIAIVSCVPEVDIQDTDTLMLIKSLCLCLCPFLFFIFLHLADFLLFIDDSISLCM